MKILLLGDSHGRLDTVSHVMRLAADRYGVTEAIQVGDFGFYPEIISRYWPKLRFPYPLHAICGNHEDHKWLNEEANLAGLAETMNLHYRQRGSRIRLGGTEIGFCGGALNVDRRQEWHGQWQRDGSLTGQNNPRWANYVTELDVMRASSNWLSGVDLAVTHSCPADIGIGIRGNPAYLDSISRFIVRPGYGNPGMDDVGEAALTRLYRLLPTKPKNWVFGHFHQHLQRKVEDTVFTCVGTCDSTDIRAIWLYDTETKEVTAEPYPG